jgi:hypothetical protein
VVVLFVPCDEEGLLVEMLFVLDDDDELFFIFPPLSLSPEEEVFSVFTEVALDDDLVDEVFEFLVDVDVDVFTLVVLVLVDVDVATPEVTVEVSADAEIELPGSLSSLVSIIASRSFDLSLLDFDEVFGNADAPFLSSEVVLMASSFEEDILSLYTNMKDISVAEEVQL